jgi:uncharacterized cupredoxin-like copper-binding protein
LAAEDNALRSAIYHHGFMFRKALVVALVALGACGGKGSGSKAASNSSARPRPQTYGRGGLPAEATRTVEIKMADNLRFDPATLGVKHGEIVTFHVVNTGKVLHELTIGGQDAQDLHEAQMAEMSMTGGTMAGGMDMGSMPGMEHGTMPNTPEHRKYMKNLTARIASLDKSAAANASVHVPAGESRDMTWAFLGDQLPVFGCHVDQHWSGGMRGTFAWAS